MTLNEDFDEKEAADLANVDLSDDGENDGRELDFDHAERKGSLSDEDVDDGTIKPPKGDFISLVKDVKRFDTKKNRDRKK
jgi:hypothetical protein